MDPFALKQILFASLRSNIQPSKPVELPLSIGIQRRLNCPFRSAFRWVGKLQQIVFRIDFVFRLELFLKRLEVLL